MRSSAALPIASPGAKSKALIATQTPIRRAGGKAT